MRVVAGNRCDASNHRVWRIITDCAYRVGQKAGHFVLRLVTVEILVRSASNLDQIKAISFLTLNRNLFESTSENKVAPSSE